MKCLKRDVILTGGQYQAADLRDVPRGHSDPFRASEQQVGSYSLYVALRVCNEEAML